MEVEAIMAQFDECVLLPREKCSDAVAFQSLDCVMFTLCAIEHRAQNKTSRRDRNSGGSSAVERRPAARAVTRCIKAAAAARKYSPPISPQKRFFSARSAAARTRLQQPPPPSVLARAGPTTHTLHNSNTDFQFEHLK